MQTIQDLQPSPQSIRQEVAPGDHVRLVANNVAYDLEVSAVESDAIHGQDSAGKAYRVHFAAIKTMTVEKDRTTGWDRAVAGAIGVVAALYRLRPSRCCGASAARRLRPLSIPGSAERPMAEEGHIGLP